MQSSLVKPSTIKGENGLERPPRSTQASAVPPVFTQSQGHLLPHNPAIMTSQVARHLSEGTGGELSGEAGWLVGWGGVGGFLLCLMALASRLCGRWEGIRMFSHHMLLQRSKRLPTLESHTKYRLPISMDLKTLQFVQRRLLAQHRGNVAGVLGGPPPLLLGLPSIFKMASHVCHFKAGWRCAFFSGGGLVPKGSAEGTRRQKSRCLEKQNRAPASRAPLGV